MSPPRARLGNCIDGPATGYSYLPTSLVMSAILLYSLSSSMSSIFRTSPGASLSRARTIRSSLLAGKSLSLRYRSTAAGLGRSAWPRLPSLALCPPSCLPPRLAAFNRRRPAPLPYLPRAAPACHCAHFRQHAPVPADRKPLAALANTPAPPYACSPVSVVGWMKHGRLSE